MTAPPLTAQDVAQFLRDNPDFFADNASVFADLKVPHPHQAHAISLGERQLLIDWCASLLSEDDAHRLPDLIIQGLSRLFDLPDIALRLWDLPDPAKHSIITQDVSPSVRQDASNRDHPYCGPANGHEAASWLANAPESLALLPIELGEPARTVGLLVLGSPDVKRFTEDMGTEFLQTIATLASASLSRLAGPEQPKSA